MNFKEIFKLKYEQVINQHSVIYDGRVYYTNIESDMTALWELISQHIHHIQVEYDEKLHEQENKYTGKLRTIRNKYNNSQSEVKKLQQELIRPFPVNAEPLRAPYRLDLTEYFVNVDKSYDAGGQLEALKDHLPSAVYLSDTTIGEYQGTIKVIFQLEDYIFLYHTDFGSCSGCDVLAACYGDIDATNVAVKRSLSDGNTLQFWNLEHAIAYCKAPSNDRYKEWVWDDNTKEMFKNAKICFEKNREMEGLK